MLQRVLIDQIKNREILRSPSLSPTMTVTQGSYTSKGAETNQYAWVKDYKESASSSRKWPYILFEGKRAGDERPILL